MHDARRRSLAWGVVAGKRRPQLARELGLTGEQVQEYLAWPGMALLTWIWTGFQAHRRRGGVMDALGSVRQLLGLVLADRRPGRAGFVQLLLALVALIGGLALGVFRDLCGEMDRCRVLGPRSPSPLSPARLQMVHALAALIEQLAGDHIRRRCGERLAEVTADFHALALEGHDPYLLLVDEPILAAAEAGPVRHARGTDRRALRPAATSIGVRPDSVGYGRRRRTMHPPARPPPGARAAAHLISGPSRLGPLIAVGPWRRGSSASPAAGPPGVSTTSARAHPAWSIFTLSENAPARVGLRPVAPSGPERFRPDRKRSGTGRAA